MSNFSMPIRWWLAFCGSQMIAFIAATSVSPLYLRYLSGVLLIPGSLLMLLFGRILGRSMGNTKLEALAIIVLLALNATSWLMVYRWMTARRSSEARAANRKR